jgi:hypothetical protein
VRAEFIKEKPAYFHNGIWLLARVTITEAAVAGHEDGGFRTVRLGRVSPHVTPIPPPKLVQDRNASAGSQLSSL